MVEIEKLQEKLGEALGLEMAAQEAVKELGSKGLLDENGMITQLKKMQSQAGNHETKLEEVVQSLADGSGEFDPTKVHVVKNYQEQALESTGKMVEEYIEAQKSVIDSVVSSSAAYYENANRMFNYWYSPRVPAEIYVRAVSNIAENVSASVTIGNDILFGNAQAFGNAFERAQRQTKELSRINVDNAKTIANTAKETAAEFSVNRQKEVL